MFRDDATPQGATPTEPSPMAAKSLGLPVEPRRLLWAIWGFRRWGAIAVVVTGLIGAAVGKFAVPKSYLSSATLLWQPATSARSDEVREVATLAQSVKVPANLLRVRERLKLSNSIEQLARGVEVSLGENSHLMLISARSSSRQEAADLAQAVVEVFLDAQREQAQSKLQETVNALQQSLKQAQQEATQARGRYDAFRSEHRVDDFSADVQAAITEAARLRVSAGDVSVELRGLEARLQALKGARSNFSERVVLSRNEQNEDQARLGRLESELAGLRARFTDDHPRVKSASAEVDALRGRVEDATPTVVGQVVGRNPVRDALVMQVEESTALRKAMAERARALADLRQAAEQRASLLTQVQGEAARLLAEVQANEAHVALLLKQIAMAEDDVRGATSGFQVLSKPLPPERSEKGFGRIVAVAFPGVALVLSILIALVRELRTGCVRAASEVAYWLKAPVIWASSWPGAGAPAVLARELADHLENRGAVVGVLGMGGAPSQEVVALLSQRLASRSCPVSIWDAREEEVVGPDALPEACEDPRIGRKLRAKAARGNLVLVVGLEDAEIEQLRALSRWMDGLLVVITSGKVRLLDLRSLPDSLPRLQGKMGAVVVAQPDELGGREVRGPEWLPPPAPARLLQRKLERKGPRRRALLRGANP
ncbi:MAG: hypothetical protein MUF64_03560 [Polyangiaceae bacterium]|jgi:uncharacterized protein involved in exopolysaccharide biosynthesis|nr:hypothetical protein [Polyangiaceae bacterium]